MGNKISRRRDTLANSAEATATEQTSAEEPAAPQPAQDSEIAQTQEAVQTENLDVVLGEPVTLLASLPSEECVSECKDIESPAAPAPLNDAEPEPVAKEDPAPEQPEPLVTANEPSPPEPEPEPEPAAEPKPVAEAQIAPEPIPEPEPTLNPEAEAEVAPEPIAEVAPEPIAESVPAPTEALEQQTDVITQESLPEPVISSPNLGVPDATLQPVDTAPSPAPIPADEPSDIPMAEEIQDIAQVSVTSKLEPEKVEEKLESVEKPMEVEPAGNLEQLVSDAIEERVSEILQNIDLTGNDLVDDLISTVVEDPDNTPITGTSTVTDLM